jgi:hypothetical protein
MRRKRERERENGRVKHSFREIIGVFFSLPKTNNERLDLLSGRAVNFECLFRSIRIN